MRDDWREGGFGLYVHWPFCQAKCPYCDFNSHVVSAVDQGRWADAFEAEIARYGAETGRRVLSSIFFGGGTPSLMQPEVVSRVIEAARGQWDFANDIEVTLEANPTSAEAGRFEGYREAGVNRLSMGVQALNDPDLRALGRLHSAGEAMEAFAMARELFGRVSFDLIYARQGQSVEAWAAELERALGLAVDHLSLYQLTIEDGTAFGARHRAGKLAGLPGEDAADDMWDVTQALTVAAGMPAYEVSNHAAKGAESRHNLVYWRSGDWVGVGPGAHGRLTLDGQRWATETPLQPGAWLAAAEAGRGENGREALGQPERLEELLLMGLRLEDGVDRARAEALGISEFSRNVSALTDIGMLESTGPRLRATEAGRPVLNAVLRRLLD
ncbi:radical SAM family heme chaperone HemW [Pseudoroseicyclus tamaricis]|uniref:radical SAM family heme chaperone HemW n=1 Tax=Pseudoroseicyclus tamaricis TaxID=2705421 RepID=UPI001F336B32|nr:radical SAM family heme chaperone HemW [Pseudoroseicyclus tamaricis]